MASIKRYKTARGTAWRVQYRSPDGRSHTKQGFRLLDTYLNHLERKTA